MILISHRGNINGVNPHQENHPNFIEKAINQGYDVEIDIRFDKESLWLGHDKPQYPTTIEWLRDRKKSLWIHCKDFASLAILLPLDLRIFYHQKEDYTIISDKHIWAHNLQVLDSQCIIPLLSKKEIEKWTPQPIYGVCSDYIQILKEKLS
jgi:hypothetical protein